MRPHLLPLLWPIVWLAMGCAPDRRVAGGRFQKRVPRPGWHVALGRASTPTTDQQAQGSEPPRQFPVHAAPTSATRSGDLLAAMPTDIPVRASAPSPPQVVPPPLTLSLLPHASRAASADPTDDYAGDMPRGPANKLGIVALVLVTAGIVTAFTSNSAVLVALLVAAGIVLAAIALRRIRSLAQRGKGFALVALILGMAAALLTIMMIVRTGW